MPDDNMTPTQPTTAPTEPTNAADSEAPATPEAPVSDAVVMPEIPETPAPTGNEIYAKVIEKIDASHNVLIALSSDPSVDELCAAIGLSLYLDKLGKRATAIYSGTTPNALEFLKPQDTFEPTADVLQDFVIALSKEKADHLRYKLDGDYVKVYITPFRTKITEGDLDFSYGDYNVDLVIALNVANGIDLDSALREHGRIMHDAVVINVTTGNPGKFGEIEWSEKSSSSVSEMIARFLYSVKVEIELGKEDATAFLTGIVAATNRFSNAATTPETMTVASRLMESGANQQLISKNITPETDNQLLTATNSKPMADAPKEGTSSNIEIDHPANSDEEEAKTPDEVPSNEAEETTKTLDTNSSEEDKPTEDATEPTLVKDDGPSLLDDLKAAEESLAKSANDIQSAESSALEETQPELQKKAESPATPVESTAPSMPPVEFPESPESPEPSETLASESTPENGGEVKSELVINPPSDIGGGSSEDDPSKYGKMLEDALNNIGANPAAANTPQVASTPEANAVPEMDYMPMPGDEVLPPPPAPPLDMNGAATPPEVPAATSEIIPDPAPNPLGAQPAMQDQVYNPGANDPGAFQIPGA